MEIINTREKRRPVGQVGKPSNSNNKGTVMNTRIAIVLVCVSLRLGVPPQMPRNPVPLISWVTPPSTPPGGPDFTLGVNGSGFVAGSIVRWNGLNRATTFVSANQL